MREPNPLYERQYPVDGFSLAERDRRWSTVRNLMAMAGIDILVVPTPSNSRYLTQVAYDIGPTIIPLEGEVTALTAQGRVGSAALAWVQDIRRWNRRWTDGIVERLQELDAGRKIIGVDGLDGLMRRPDGDLNYGTFITLREYFPHARWVAATVLLQEARYLKSEEEIAALTRAAAAADAGLLEMAAAMRPGVTDRELWSEMVRGMLGAGGDPPEFAHVGVAAASDTRGLPVHPVGHVVEPGDVLLDEVDGLFQGYAAQGVQPVALAPLPAAWRDAWQVHLEAWDRTWEVLRPGVTFGEVRSAVAAAAQGGFESQQALHGQGLGDDMPLITSTSSHASQMLDRTLDVGTCFVLKPSSCWTDTQGPKRLNWGDTIVITRDGPRRLGTRPHELIVQS